MKTIEIKIPKGFMNCGVSIKNFFIADTNDSANWDTIRFPLPKPENKWEIKQIDNQIVVLIDK